LLKGWHANNNWQVSLTALAQQLLNNETDWLVLNPLQRWVGGISINSRNGPVWRIDRENNKISSLKSI